MAISTSFGYTDTSATFTVETLQPAKLNYKSDFAVKSTESTPTKSLVELVNTTTPLGQSETIRIGCSKLANIYANKNIPLDNQFLQKEGRKILISINDTLRITDPNNISYVKDAPFGCQIVLTVPENAFTDDAVIKSVITRALGALYDNGKFSALKILKGAITPTDL